MSIRSMTVLTVASVGLLASGSVAQAATISSVVVSEIATDDSWGPINTGWSDLGSGVVEIGSAYGAPTGLGREALMLDTPAGDHDMVAVAALAAAPEVPLRASAFPSNAAGADLELGFWLYLPSQSTSSPVLRAALAVRGDSWANLEFDPIVNGYTQRDQWVYVDTTAPDMTWNVLHLSLVPGIGVTEVLTWQQIADKAAQVPNPDGPPTFTWGFSFHQDPGTSSAIDGVTFGDATTATVVNFELAATSARPLLDNCKNNGWQTHPAGTFKNQGACIAATLAGT